MTEAQRQERDSTLCRRSDRRSDRMLPAPVAA